MIKYYVAYQTPKGVGAAFMKTDTPYTTKAAMEALIEYISKTYYKGENVVILNIIRLENDDEA